jgi:hypothetical protein
MVRAAGLSFIFAGAVALVVRTLVGNAVVDDLAKTAAMQPAIEDVWRVSTTFLVGVATATIAYGVLAVAGAWLAGPTRYAVRARTFAAPYVRDPRIVYGAVAAVVLLVLLWGPTEGTRRPLPALILVVLLLAGVEALRRQIMREVPEALPEPAAEADTTFTPPEPPIVTST